MYFVSINHRIFNISAFYLVSVYDSYFVSIHNLYFVSNIQFIFQNKFKVSTLHWTASKLGSGASVAITIVSNQNSNFTEFFFAITIVSNQNSFFAITIVSN